MGDAKPELHSERMAGVVVGIVSNNRDVEGLSRVQVTFPWLPAGQHVHWARVTTFMAGHNRGALFLPEEGDEVLVAFEHGDLHQPYVIGALWNGKDRPPLTNNDGRNNVRLIHSRSGHEVILDDTDGSEKIEIKDKTGKNSIVWDTASSTITISAGKDISLKAPQGTISLDAQEVVIKSSGNTAVETSGAMMLNGVTIDD